MWDATCGEEAESARDWVALDVRLLFVTQATQQAAGASFPELPSSASCALRACLLLPTSPRIGQQPRSAGLVLASISTR